MGGFDTVFIEVKETSAGLCCQIEGEDVWFPKSQIRDESEVFGEGDSGTLAVPRWLAEDKGVDYE